MFAKKKYKLDDRRHVVNCVKNFQHNFNHNENLEDLEIFISETLPLVYYEMITFYFMKRDSLKNEWMYATMKNLPPQNCAKPTEAINPPQL